MEILCCPVCRGDLSLTVAKKDGEEIVEERCAAPSARAEYPIEDGIPNLLPPDERGLIEESGAGPRRDRLSLDRHRPDGPPSPLAMRSGRQRRSDILPGIGKIRCPRG